MGKHEETGNTAAGRQNALHHEAQPDVSAPSDLLGTSGRVLSLHFNARSDTIEGILALAQEWGAQNGLAREDGLSLRLVLDELLANIRMKGAVVWGGVHWDAVLVCKNNEVSVVGLTSKHIEERKITTFLTDMADILSFAG